jgi:tetratricopeptide (TPR) repeat protein
MRFLLISVCILACALFCAATEEPWVEVRSPNFLVVSNASAGQAQRVANNLEQFRAVVRFLFPKMKLDPGLPPTVIATRNEKDMKALLPSERQENGVAQTAGMFLAGPERNFILLSAEAPGNEGYHVIYHEYTHVLMNLNFRNLPLWLSEGFADLLGFATISDEESGLGKVRPEVLRILRESSIRLPVLMSVTKDSPYYRQQDKMEIFYSWSWALTHYLMLGDKQAHSRQLREFIGLLQDGVPKEEAIRRTLGDLKVLEKNLKKYINSNMFYYYKIPIQLKNREDSYAVRVLPPADSLAIRGIVLVYGGRLDDAKTMLDQALQLDPRSAVANEGQGSLYWRQHDLEQAKNYFAAAAELDSKSFLAQYFAAQLAYERDQDYGAAEDYLRKAIALNPNFGRAFAMLYQILMNQEAKLPEAFEVCKKAAELEPFEMNHRLNIGRILIRLHRCDEAQSHAEHLRATSRTDAERTQAESLLSMVKRQCHASPSSSSRERLLPYYPAVMLAAKEVQQRSKGLFQSDRPAKER